MPDITYDVGRVSFVMKGAWNLATNYEKLDAVSYNGSLYIAKQDVPGGTAITNTTYWQLAAEKGDKGDTGGVDSVNGQQGDVWFPDSRQLISDGYTTDTEPFLMKGNDTDSDRFELAKKLGNTAGVNQLCPALESGNWTSEAGVTASYSNGVLTYSTATANNGIYSSSVQSAPPAGHKYLIAFTGSATASAYLRVGLPSATGVLTQTAVTTTKTRYSAIFTSNGATGNTRIYLYSASTGVTFTIEGIEIRDLTLWFGSNDRIPSDLLSHPENWGRYYAGSLDYAAGYLDSADGTVLTSIGADGITVLAEVDTGSEVLRSAGTAADEKLPGGQIARKVGYVDLGSIGWSFAANASGQTFTTALASVIRKGSGGHHGDYIQSNLFVGVNKSSMSNLAEAEMSIDASGNLQICKSSFANYSAAQIRTALSGIYLYYELATPITEQGTAFAPIVATVKGGVLSWTNTKGIPVGHESHFFENLRKRVEDRLPDPPSADGTYRLTCTISGGVKTYSWEA